MASIATKLVTAIASAGVVGGAGYGVYALTDTTDSIENYLKKSSFTITLQNDEASWTKVLETYKLEATDDLKIKDEDITQSKDIKDWCKEMLAKKIKSKDDDYKKASKWCVKYDVIKDKLGEGAKLETKAETLNTNYNNFPKEVKDSISEIKLQGTKQHENGEKTIQWCKQNQNRTYSNDTEFFFANTKKYCLGS
ncbi:hypothetical protein A6V39_03930 [Candidatus Mycoplasma haematobovis]|uniref:Uncharacterized protein n=1 Tax=Candidatus Mycoplasma haematobovis TaxID=432608 RepID=A0A1A9QC43_9MOLU|nr:hypothetical protein [Candidatus Mycoplasma haematobovis]OAL10037.1 hypothetical protein A6V39_03930 [Candidatus Mycoplasma haematobovis]